MADMDGSGWKWPDMAGMAGNGWKWLDMAGNGWKWLDMAGNVWKWLEIRVSLFSLDRELKRSDQRNYVSMPIKLESKISDFELIF